MGIKNITICFAITLLVFAWGCNALPKGILTEDQTAAMLADIKLTESGHWTNNNAAATTVKLNQTQMPEVPAEVKNPNQDSYNDYAFIAKKHKTTIDQFKKSMEYYYKNPTKLEKVLNKTLVIIQKNDAEHRRAK